MICRILKDFVYDKLLDNVPMVELRLDTMQNLSFKRLDKWLKNAKCLTIATCRYNEVKKLFKTNKATHNYVIENLLMAVVNGAKMVDIEHDMPIDIQLRVIAEARNRNVAVIRSYHGNECPTIEKLQSIYEQLVAGGADFVKIAVAGHEEHDKETINQLYAKVSHPERLIAFLTGKKYQSTRYTAVKRGAPWIYACSENEKGKNELGIPSVKQVEKHIYKRELTYPVNELFAYSSKSAVQRQIIIAGLGNRQSIIKMVGYISNDIQAAVDAVKQIGCNVAVFNNEGSKPHTVEFHVHPPKIFRPISTIDVGESGFVCRMMMAIIPAINQGKPCIFRGSGTLLNRSLNNEAAILSQLGIECKNVNDTVIPNTDCTLHVPFELSGQLKAGTYTIDKATSSQLVSGLLIAFTLLHKESTLTVLNTTSNAYIDMTLRLLRPTAFIANGSPLPASQTAINRNSLTNIRSFVIHSGLHPVDLWQTTDVDVSGMLNFIIMATICCKVDFVNHWLNSIVNHPDYPFLKCYSWFNLHYRSTPPISVRQGLCLPFDFDISECPDSAMAISLYALMCNGKSTIKGMHRLGNKESNRFKAIVETIKQLGGTKCIKVLDNDTIEINGMTYERRLLTNHLLKGGDFKSYNDHRIVMMVKIAETFADKMCRLDTTTPVMKSYPSFNNDYNKIKY